MSCEYTWTVMGQGAIGGLSPLVPRTRDAVLIPTGAPPASGRSERPATIAILRARATVERSRALLTIAVNLLRHVLFTERRRRLVRKGETAIH